MFEVIVGGLVLGFVVALITGFLLSVHKARKLPGGSLVVGISSALFVDPSSVLLLSIGALAGLAGWAIYTWITK